MPQNLQEVGRDPVLASLYAEPFRLIRPEEQRVPFVFASPHSGNVYPASFIARSRLSAIALRRSEDAFVDELMAPVHEFGAPLIAARFPRAFVDVNRASDELDSHMFEGDVAVGSDTPSTRVAAGLGVIPRIVRDGAEIYRTKLSATEAKERIARLYRPYHSALAALVDETASRFGVAVVVDCHSMPSAAAVPDIVLGDRYGMSAAPSLMRIADAAFQRQGFTVARNTPYAGGHTTLVHGRRERDIHAIQIEINRSLYLDEERILRGARFAEVKSRLSAGLAELVAADPSLLRRRQAPRFAAE